MQIRESQASQPRPSAEDVKRLLKEWRSALRGTHRPEQGVPPILAGRVARARREGMLFEHLAFAEDLLRALCRAGNGTLAHRGLTAVSQYYGILEPPRARYSDVRVRRALSKSGAAKGPWVGRDSIEDYLIPEALRVLAAVIDVPAAPDGGEAHLDRYPRYVKRPPTQDEEPSHRTQHQEGDGIVSTNSPRTNWVGELRPFDIKAGLGLMHERFHKDVVEKASRLDFDTHLHDQERLEPLGDRPKSTLRLLFALVPVDETYNPAFPYSLPADLEVIERLPNGLRPLADRALQFEVLAAGDVERLLHTADRDNGLHRPDPTTARLLYLAALRAISLHRFDTSGHQPPQARRATYRQEHLGRWGELEVRALQGLLTILRLEEDSGAFVVSRRLLAVLPDKDVRRLQAFIDRIIVATGHRMFPYAERQLTNLKGAFGEIRPVLPLREAQEWHQQIPLVEASVPVRRLRSDTGDPARARRDVSNAVRAAKEALRRAEEIRAPEAWRLASVRRLAEPFTAFSRDQIRTDSSLERRAKGAGDLLAQQRKRALNEHREFALAHLKTEAMLALASPAGDAHERLDQVLHYVGEFAEQFTRIPRWSLEVHWLAELARQRWGDRWEPPIQLPEVPTRFNHRHPPHQRRLLHTIQGRSG